MEHREPDGLFGIQATTYSYVYKILFFNSPDLPVAQFVLLILVSLAASFACLAVGYQTKLSCLTLVYQLGTPEGTAETL